MPEAFQELWCNQPRPGAQLHTGQSAHPSANKANEAKAERPAWDTPAVTGLGCFSTAAPGQPELQDLASLSCSTRGLWGRREVQGTQPSRTSMCPNLATRNRTELKGHSSCLPQLPGLVQANKTRTVELEREGKRRKRQNCVPVNALAVFKQTIAYCRELKGEPRTSLPNLESLSVPKTSKFSNILDRNEFP